MSWSTPSPSVTCLRIMYSVTGDNRWSGRFTQTVWRPSVTLVICVSLDRGSRLTEKFLIPWFLCVYYEVIKNFVVCLLFILNIVFVVYYESIKRELQIRPTYDCRCDERLKLKLRILHVSYTLGSAGIKNSRLTIFYTRRRTIFYTVLIFMLLSPDFGWFLVFLVVWIEGTWRISSTGTFNNSPPTLIPPSKE